MLCDCISGLISLILFLFFLMLTSITQKEALLWSLRRIKHCIMSTQCKAFFFFYFPRGSSRTHAGKTRQLKPGYINWILSPYRSLLNGNALHTSRHAPTYEYNHLSNTSVHALFRCFTDKNAQLQSWMFFLFNNPTDTTKQWISNIVVVVCIIGDDQLTQGMSWAIVDLFTTT